MDITICDRGATLPNGVTRTFRYHVWVDGHHTQNFRTLAAAMRFGHRFAGAIVRLTMDVPR